jgi:hypothetical protein
MRSDVVNGMEEEKKGRERFLSVIEKPNSTTQTKEMCAI